MPGYDGTGPMGMGPMTGMGRAYCAAAGGVSYPRVNTGSLPVRRAGRRRRKMYYAMGKTEWQKEGNGEAFLPQEFTPDQEKDILKSEAEALKRELDDVQSRIEVLDRLGEDKENR